PPAVASPGPGRARARRWGSCPSKKVDCVLRRVRRAPLGVPHRLRRAHPLPVIGRRDAVVLSLLWNAAHLRARRLSRGSARAPGGWLTPSPPAAEATLADRRSFRMNAGQGRWCPPGALASRAGRWVGGRRLSSDGAVPPRAGIATMGRGDASARALPAKTRGRPRGCPW